MRQIQEISGDDQWKRFPIPKGTHIYFGHAIAIMELVDCRPMTKADEDKTFVKYREPWTEIHVSKKTGKKRIVKKQLWCHVYADVTPIKPIPWKGSQGWKTVPESFKQQIEIL